MTLYIYIHRYITLHYITLHTLHYITSHHITLHTRPLHTTPDHTIPYPTIPYHTISWLTIKCWYPIVILRQTWSLPLDATILRQSPCEHVAILVAPSVMEQQNGIIKVIQKNLPRKLKPWGPEHENCAKVTFLCRETKKWWEESNLVPPKSHTLRYASAFIYRSAIIMVYSDLIR